MNNSRIFDLRLLVTLLISILFGLAFNKILPLLSAKPLLLLALPASIIFFTILVIKPLWVLIAIFFSRPLLDNVLNMTKVGGSFGAGAILNLSIILLAIFLAFYYSTFPRHNRQVNLWIIYLLVVLITVSYTPFQQAGIRLYFNYLSFFAMFLVPFLVIKTKEHYFFWLYLFAASFILPVVWGNVDLIHGGRYTKDAGLRIFGSFTHPNILAFYMVLGLTLYFHIIKAGYVRSKKLIFCMRLIMLNMLVLIVASKTRNAWIACLAVFFIYGLLKDRKVLLILLLCLPLSLAVPQVRQRLNH